MASWVIKNRVTGQVLFETFDKREADKFRTDAYQVVPIKEYLCGLNKIEAPSVMAQPN